MTGPAQAFNKPPVVLDTCILISALQYHHNDRQGRIYRMADSALKRALRSYTLVFTALTRAELEHTLFRKPAFQDIRMRDKARFLNLLDRKGELISPSVAFRSCADRSDNKIVEAALSADARYLVTEDHDLLDIRKRADLHIVRPGTFLHKTSETKPDNRQKLLRQQQQREHRHERHTWKGEILRV